MNAVTPDLKRQMREAINRAEPLAGFDLKNPGDILMGGATLGIFGDSGAGKTAISATAIEFFKRLDVIGPDVRTLYLEAEGGLGPIRSRTDFQYKSIFDFNEFCKISDALITTPNLRNAHPVIVVDNLSEIAEMSMQQVLKESRHEEPEWSDWRKNSRIVVTRVRKLRDAARQQGVVVIINLWNREDQDADGRVRKVSVELNPALAKVFVAAVDIAAFLEVFDDEGRRVLHLGQSSRVKAKFRQDIMDPTMLGIPLDLYGPPSSQGVLSLAPLVATLIGGEPFPARDYAIPAGATPTRFAAPPARRPAASTNGADEETPAERKRRERREAAEATRN